MLEWVSLGVSVVTVMSQVLRAQSLLSVGPRLDSLGSGKTLSRLDVHLLPVFLSNSKVSNRLQSGRDHFSSPSPAPSPPTAFRCHPEKLSQRETISVLHCEYTYATETVTVFRG